MRLSIHRAYETILSGLTKSTEHTSSCHSGEWSVSGSLQEAPSFTVSLCA